MSAVHLIKFSVFPQIIMHETQHQNNGIVVKHADVAMFTATSILSNTKRDEYFFVVSFDFNLNLSATVNC